MPRSKKPRIPAYRKHQSGSKQRKSPISYGFAVFRKVTYRFPGKYGSPESMDAYYKFLAEVAKVQSQEAENRRVIDHGGSPTVAHLCLQYLRMLKPAGADTRPPAEFYHAKRAVAFLLENHADVLLSSFGPKALREVRDQMTQSQVMRRRKKAVDGKAVEVLEPTGKMLTRRYINDQVNRIRRMFRWGVSEELVPPQVLEALKSVPSLRRGLTIARETLPVTPLEDDETLPKVIAAASPTIAAMIQLQDITGMRSGELCIMRPCDIDRRGDVWIYQPQEHKKQHLGDDEPVALGPRAQKIITPFLDRDPEAYLFSAAESVRWYNQQRWKNRKVAKKRRPVGPRKVRDFFTPDTYRKAVLAASRRAGVGHWFPYQLRHGAATRVRKKYKLEGAQVFLRHKNANVTQVYAERDLELYRNIAREIG